MSGDINLDGDLDDDDKTLITNYSGRLGGDGVLSIDDVANDIGYAAYLFNDETDNSHVRNREYSYELGRFLQRDRLEYPDGMNLYQYMRRHPLTGRDPYGLLSPRDYDNQGEGGRGFGIPTSFPGDAVLPSPAAIGNACRNIGLTIWAHLYLIGQGPYPVTIPQPATAGPSTYPQPGDPNYFPFKVKPNSCVDMGSGRRDRNPDGSPKTGLDQQEEMEEAQKRAREEYRKAGGKKDGGGRIHNIGKSEQRGKQFLKDFTGPGSGSGNTRDDDDDDEGEGGGDG